MQTGKRRGWSMIAKVSKVMMAALPSLMINVSKPYAGFEISLDGNSLSKVKEHAEDVGKMCYLGTVFVYIKPDKQNRGRKK